MNNDYEKQKQVFDKYIDECRKRIKDTFFKKDYLEQNQNIRNNLVKNGKLPESTSIEDAIKNERLQMINIKINHTLRIVEDVMKMSEKLNVNIDFSYVLKVSALLHDIGRFDQATWNNSFAESAYKDIDGINNHAQAGYHILFNNERIDDYQIDKRFHPAIGSVVYNHGNPVLTGDLAFRVDDINKLDVSKLTGSRDLNDGEKVIVSALVQMVRDVDMLDILYQHLTGEFPVIRNDLSYKINGESIEDVAKHFGISTKDLMEYNHMTNEEEINSMKTIGVPVDKIDLKSLTVPKDIQEKFYKNENMDLKELMGRKDWTFITGMWWRLNHFLNNINFTSNLDIIRENKLLERIYNQYPDEFKFLVKDAFEFAEEKLIEGKLKQSDSNIYVNDGPIL